MLEGFLTTEEAAAIAGINSSNITRHCRLGNLPATQIGGRWFIKREDLAQWLADNPLLGTRGLGRNKKGVQDE